MRQPMLAAKATDEQLFGLTYPMLASPKIDGIRAVVKDGQVTSRSMKLIRNGFVQTLFGKSAFEGFDGELVVGNPTDPNLMQQTSSGVMSYDGAPDVKYYVFDRWNYQAGFNRRLQSVRELVQYFNSPRVVFHEHLIVNSYDDMLEYEALCLEEGYEGIMLRKMDGRYKDGRSTLREQLLVKVKRYLDAEARIIGWKSLERNHNEATEDERGYTKRSHSMHGKVADTLLGTLYVKDLETGVEFFVGSGFTLAQRQTLWDNREQLEGKIITYKHLPIGVKDKPRTPIFKSFRSPLDM